MKYTDYRQTCGKDYKVNTYVYYNPHLTDLLRGRKFEKPDLEYLMQIYETDYTTYAALRHSLHTNKSDDIDGINKYFYCHDNMPKHKEGYMIYMRAKRQFDS